MNESDLCAFGIPEFMPSDGGGLLKERYKSYPDRLRFQVAFVSQSDRSVCLWQGGKGSGQFFLTGNVIFHFPVIELLVSHHVKVSRAGETENDGLFFALCKWHSHV